MVLTTDVLMFNNSYLTSQRCKRRREVEIMKEEYPWVKTPWGT